jgi:hypothetical protein
MEFQRLAETEAAIARGEAAVAELTDALQVLEERLRDLRQPHVVLPASPGRQTSGAQEREWRQIVL